MFSIVFIVSKLSCTIQTWCENVIKELGFFFVKAIYDLMLNLHLLKMQFLTHVLPRAQINNLQKPYRMPFKRNIPIHTVSDSNDPGYERMI